jgi:3-phenylpropionate/trans-cinnamate dioxygenase ferredoxin subunit
MGWQTVGKAGSIREGDIKTFFVGDLRIAVARDGGALYAFDDECRHQRCSLSDGDLEEGTVICPCHEGTYDLKTGEVLSGPPPEPVRVYPVSEEEGDLRIDAGGG